MVVRVCVLCGTPGISQLRRVGAHPGMRGGFEISLQRYYIFWQVVGNVLPIITGGRIFSPDWSGRTWAGAVVLKFRCKGTTFFCRLLVKYDQ